MSDANLPYGADTEHDLRVRTRLVELAAERGVSVETLLTELNSILRSGRILLPTEETPPKALPGQSATVLAVRPADDVWGVVTLEYDGVPSAARQPCSGKEPCPWRRDAPPGQFPTAAFEASAATSRAGSTRRFGCHSSTPARPLICAGWLLRGAEGNAEVQALMAAGQIARPELPEGVELYDSYAEMAAANGVTPEQGTAGLVPLQHFVDDHYIEEKARTMGWVEALTTELKRSMPPDALLGLVLDCDGTVLQLELLRVSIGHRGQGHAARVLGLICAAADARELIVVCTPTDEFGADLQRLERFYRRHGFAPAAPEDRLTAHSWQRPSAHPGRTRESV
ncbi:DUF6283 family protein [Streptomyces sp. NPDC059631]|uniref:DUF6283 family protein n=1 Tax=unclassified Streptomyces TaxID=2593676 RepID=UPI0036B05507